MHGFRVQEAFTVLKEYLVDVKKHLGETNQNQAKIKVITGKGTHGNKSPALKNAIDKFLTKEGIEHEPIQGYGGFDCNILANDQ